jgi:hypothetical protein
MTKQIPGRRSLSSLHNALHDSQFTITIMVTVCLASSTVDNQRPLLIFLHYRKMAPHKVWRISASHNTHVSWVAAIHCKAFECTEKQFDRDQDMVAVLTVTVFLCVCVCVCVNEFGEACGTSFREWKYVCYKPEENKIF